MDSFWKLAVSMTGISGVGSFVLYMLYKGWMHLPVLESLTKRDKFRIFCLFLVLTFLFAIATLGLGAYQEKHRGEKEKTVQSLGELDNVLKDRYEYGERTFRKIESDPAIPPADQAGIKEIHEEYSFSAKQLRNSIADGDLNRMNQHNKDIYKLLNSPKAKKVIPGSILDDLKDKAAAIPEDQRPKVRTEA